MNPILRSSFGLRAVVTVALATAAPAQLVRNTADLPATQTPGQDGEALALVDVDLDGDLDAVLGRHGLMLPGAQSLLWINQGGAQGGVTGRFVDETATRLPLGQDPTRGIEPADIDNDGDVDLLVVNLSYSGPSRWWVNLGGAQGGAAGFFADETATRWVGLGGPGSSFPPSVLLPSGLFPGLSADAAFGDFDDDGDLDLAYSANAEQNEGIPTRLFLNDGAGRFAEHNPSGYVLPASRLPNGAPGLWCEGVHTPNTLVSTGAECDIVSDSTDIDVADLDDDFDVDVLVGDLADAPRLYANRRFGSGLAPAVPSGGFGFRDVTGAAFPTVAANGGAHYAQELGDLDGDGDLDLYGSNWRNVGLQFFFDVTMANLGGGVFGPRVDVPGSQDDDEDCTMFDYDGDGDLDVISANFLKSVTFDTLSRNDTTAPDDLVLSDRSMDLADTQSTSTGVRAGDLDGDGDFDVLMTGGFTTAHVYFENVFDVPDTHAPRIVRVEAAPHRSAGPAPTVIHAAVLDNGPTTATATLGVTLRFTVDGGAVTLVPMRWSGGQIFRGEVPGAVEGLVTYDILAQDTRGNSSVSAAQSFLGSPAGSVGAAYCTPNPNSTGAPARIAATGSSSVAANTLALRATGLPLASPGYFLVSRDRGVIPNPAGSQGLLCLGGLIGRFVGPGQVLNSGVAGAVQLAVDLTRMPTPAGLVAVVPGELWHFSYWYRDVNPVPTTNLTDGWTIGFTP